MDLRTTVLPNVPVRDGRLTLKATSVDVNPFYDINTLVIQRVGDLDSQTPPWMPTAANAWWQKELPKSEPIGLVQITLPGQTYKPDCFKPEKDYLPCDEWGPYERNNKHDCR